MAIIAMKKVSFHCEEAMKEQLSEKLKNLEGFYPSKHSAFEGFVKAQEAEKVLSNIDATLATYTLSEPVKEDKEYPPVFLKKNFFTEPFADFIEEYALPGYFDLDHTLVFSISFCILFGIMFGDIGQGLVLIFFGLLTKPKKTSVFTRAGFFSIIFGWLYGSIFGNEEIIGEWMEHHHHAYWRFGLLERGNTSNLLLMVMSLGAAMILITMLMNIIDKFKEGKVVTALMANNGIAGFVMYSSIMLTGFSIFYLEGESSLDFIALILVLVSAVVILIYAFKKYSGKHKGKELVMESLHYLWHTTLEFASSTMSFLMVACFALAHASLMFVVYHIAERSGNLSLVVIILGNLLVMGIEATEVWHQCLKIEHDVLYKFIEE